AQQIEIGAGMAQHLAGGLVERQRIEQVLGAGVLVAEPAGLGDRDGERDLEGLGQPHRWPPLPAKPPAPSGSSASWGSSGSLAPCGSTVSSSGMPSCRASSMTSATLVSATSRV